MKIPQQIVGQMSKNQHRAMLKICIMQRKPTERGPSLHDIRTWNRRVEVCGQATMGLMQKRYLQWTPHSTERISSYYKLESWFAVPRRVESWVNPGTAGMVCSPCPRLRIALAVTISITADGVMMAFDRRTSHTLYHRVAVNPLNLTVNN